MVSILASVLIWLFTNLANVSADTVSLPVMVHTNIEGHRESASSPVTITASISAKGYRLLKLKSVKDPLDLYVESTHLEFRDGDFYTLGSSALYRYVQDIFGQGVTVQSFVTPSLTLRFPPENNKKVSIAPVRVVKFASQYMAMGEMTVSPDSVLIYGEPQRLESIDRVFTKTISLSGVKRNVSGVVKLEAPAGTRLSFGEVNYSMDVTRFVEMRSSAPVQVRNVPDGRNLTVLPLQAEIVCRYVFPLAGTSVQTPALFIDYNDFVKSRSGKCLIRHDALPTGMIDIKIVPSVCDCLESSLN
ncbi:MAG: YbbR-like domain-containing protein [Bacteroidales bacterium]|nr:YbbR-like domain-containing protein [Candidatus Cryptobacteroides aphodequi]